MLAVVLAVALWIVSRKLDNTKRAVVTILIPYLFLVVASTFLTRGANEYSHIIVMPFWTIHRIITGGKQKAWLVKELLMNILMLMPVGILAPVLFTERKYLKTLLLGLSISISIELLQLISHRGFPEIDDIISNTLGVFVGNGIYCSVRRKG